MGFSQTKKYGSDNVGSSIEAVFIMVVGSIFIPGLLILGYAALSLSIMGVLVVLSLILSLAPLFIMSVLLYSIVEVLWQWKPVVSYH